MVNNMEMHMNAFINRLLRVKYDITLLNITEIIK